MDSGMGANKWVLWYLLGLVALVRGICGPGLNSCVGVLFPWVKEETGMNVGVLSLFLSIAAIACLITLLLSKKVFSRLRTSAVMLLGGGFVTLSFCLLGLASGPILWCLPALSFGCGTALVVNLLGPSVVHVLLNDRMGFALGAMTTIASLVGAVMHPLLVWLIEKMGWRIACFILGGGGFALLLLASILFRLSFDKKATKEEETPIKQGTTWSIRGKSLLVFMAVITAFNMFHQHFATYAKGNGIASDALSLALSLSMIGAAVGGILIGKLGDTFGGTCGGVLTLAIGGISCILFLMAKDGVGFCIAATLHGIASSGIGVTVPVLAREFFRGRDYTYVLSRVMLGAPLSTIISMPLYGIFYDRLGSYQLPLCQLLLCLFFAGILLIFARKKTSHAM